MGEEVTIRCRMCRHWVHDPSVYYIRRTSEGIEHEYNDTGLCDSETFTVPVEGPGMWTDCGENTIRTDAEFFCAMWERKLTR